MASQITRQLRDKVHTLNSLAACCPNTDYTQTHFPRVFYSLIDVSNGIRLYESAYADDTIVEIREYTTDYIPNISRAVHRQLDALIRQYREYLADWENWHTLTTLG